MLRQRVITALVLVSIMLAALSANSAWPFAVLTLLMIAAAGWEWGRWRCFWVVVEPITRRCLAKSPSTTVLRR